MRHQAQCSSRFAATWICAAAILSIADIHQCSATSPGSAAAVLHSRHDYSETGNALYSAAAASLSIGKVAGSKVTGTIVQSGSDASAFTINDGAAGRSIRSPGGQHKRGVLESDNEFQWHNGQFARKSLQP